MITNAETASAYAGDAEMTQFARQHLGKRQLLPEEHVVDGRLRHRGPHPDSPLRPQHHLPGPVGGDTRRTKRGDGGRTSDLAQAAFHADWDAKQVTCPKGLASVTWSVQR
ncbi:hypothetical protein ACWF95_38095 [Streptomyces vinaceus]